MAATQKNRNAYHREYYKTHTEQMKGYAKRHYNKMSQVSILLQPEQHAAYKQAAKDAGMSLRAYIIDALDTKSGRK